MEASRMSKFKVGDRVKATKRSGPVVFGEVIEVAQWNCRVREFVDSGETAHDSWWGQEALELLGEPAPSPVEPARPPEQYDYRLEHYSNAQFMQNMAQRNQDQGGGLGVLSALEHARIRKELEEANARWLRADAQLMAAGRQAEAYKQEVIAGNNRRTFSCEGCEDQARLKEFSEDQARQIQKLETALSEERHASHHAGVSLGVSDRCVGRLTRELERAKRGQR